MRALSLSPDSFPAQVRFENYFPGWGFRPLSEKRDLPRPFLQQFRGGKLNQGAIAPPQAAALARHMTAARHATKITMTNGELRYLRQKYPQHLLKIDARPLTSACAAAN